MANIKNFATDSSANTSTSIDIGNRGRGFVVFAEGDDIRVMQGDLDVDTTSTPPVGVLVKGDTSVFFDRDASSENRVTVASASTDVNFAVQIVLQ